MRHKMFRFSSVALSALVIVVVIATVLLVCSIQVKGTSDLANSASNKGRVQVVKGVLGDNASSNNRTTNSTTEEPLSHPAHMTWKAWVCVASVLTVLIILFAELASCSATMFFTTLFFHLCGILDTKEFLGGLSNSGVVSVALLFIIVGPLTKLSKVRDLIEWCIEAPEEVKNENEDEQNPKDEKAIYLESDNRELTLVQKIRRSHSWALLKVCLVCMILSGFMNNTPLIAMMTPIVKNYCRDRGISPAQFLMPINGASLLGGGLTVIGTSTNLVYDSFMRTTDMGPMPFFEITKVSGICSIFCVIYLILAPPYLLPTESGGLFRLLKNNASSFVGQFLILSHSPLVGGVSKKDQNNKPSVDGGPIKPPVGVTVGEFEKLLPPHLQNNLKLAEIIRFDGNHNIVAETDASLINFARAMPSSADQNIISTTTLAPPPPHERFLPGDILVFAGDLHQLNAAARVLGLKWLPTTNLTSVVPRTMTSGDVKKMLFRGARSTKKRRGISEDNEEYEITEEMHSVTENDNVDAVSSPSPPKTRLDIDDEPDEKVILPPRRVVKKPVALRKKDQQNPAAQAIIDNDQKSSRQPKLPFTSPKSFISKALSSSGHVIDDNNGNDEDEAMTDEDEMWLESQEAAAMNGEERVEGEENELANSQSGSASATTASGSDAKEESAIDFVEVVLSHQSPCIGRSVGTGIFQRLYGVSVLALRPYGTKPANDVAAPKKKSSKKQPPLQQQQQQSDMNGNNANIQNDLVGYRLAQHLFGVGDTVLIVGNTAFLERFPTHFFVSIKSQETTETKVEQQKKRRLRIAVPSWFPWGIYAEQEEEVEKSILPDDVAAALAKAPSRKNNAEKSNNNNNSNNNDESTTDSRALLQDVMSSPRSPSNNDGAADAMKSPNTARGGSFSPTNATPALKQEGENKKKTARNLDDDAGGTASLSPHQKYIVLPEWYPYLTIPIFLVMMATAVAGIDIVVCASVAVCVIVGLRIVTVKEAISSIQFETVIMVSFSLGLGSALKNSGAADVVGYFLLTAEIRGFPLLMLIGATTSLLTNLISSQACASTMFPIIYATYKHIGQDPLGCVTMAAVLSSVALVTPYANPTNIIVMGPSGCGPVDFVKFGLPLNVMMVVLCPLVAATVYGLW